MRLERTDYMALERIPPGNGVDTCRLVLSLCYLTLLKTLDSTHHPVAYLSISYPEYTLDSIYSQYRSEPARGSL